MGLVLGLGCIPLSIIVIRAAISAPSHQSRRQSRGAANLHRPSSRNKQVAHDEADGQFLDCLRRVGLNYQFH